MNLLVQNTLVEDEWISDLELASAEMYYAAIIANDPEASTYAADAVKYATMYLDTMDYPDPPNLYDVAVIAHYEVAHIVGSAVYFFEFYFHECALQDSLYSKLTEQIQVALEVAASSAESDPFGLGLEYGESIDAAPYIMGLSVMGNIYDSLTETTTYEVFSNTQRDYVLGANGWGTSFIIGAAYARFLFSQTKFFRSDFTHGTFTNCPQHQVPKKLNILLKICRLQIWWVLLMVRPLFYLEE